ncbi:hypothetical protein ZIOFF_067877 [Zingiber officinale]|uniref:2-oxo-4-hydroxy-4-carboxy-5-ureidoimidazoline decarboxylase n=1 Tax=Zingiber officinale TaxID=94328 RepID=A0A8J5ERF0_ZINOF|nr:hypothetical protein ZIOFF_067877 [Zingiber officinale]
MCYGAAAASVSPRSSPPPHRFLTSTTQSSPPAGSGSTRWSKEEQSAAMATANDTMLQELVDWNIRYQEKFGFVFLICASRRGTLEILVELKVNC